MRKLRFWFKRYYITPGIYSLRNAAVLSVCCIAFYALIKFISPHFLPGQTLALFFLPFLFPMSKMTDRNGKKIPIWVLIIFGFQFFWLFFGSFFNLPLKNADKIEILLLEEWPLLYFFQFLWFFLLFANQKMLKRVEGEWWIDIRRESNTPTPDDLQVGKKEIDDALFIYGEPHTWWEQRIKEPQALAVLHNLLNHQDGICSITGTDGLIQIKPPFLHNVISEWMHALSQNPPTPKDWKDSAADFSVPAIKKIATASQSGSPIAVPSLTGEDEG